jgi:succinate dehydrogenase flavin-adding protein (antitoxin of CptAB toxin-antitoxin module)
MRQEAPSGSLYCNPADGRLYPMEKTTIPQEIDQDKLICFETDNTLRRDVDRQMNSKSLTEQEKARVRHRYILQYHDDDLLSLIEKQERLENRHALTARNRAISAAASKGVVC